MNRRLLSLSFLSVVLAACSSNNAKTASGGFDYLKEKEGKPLVIPSGLASPKLQNKFNIASLNTSTEWGDQLDVRSPSLVLPIAASSRVETNSDKAIIWFDQVLDDRDLYTFILDALKEQLSLDGVELQTVDESNKTFQSSWYHKEILDGSWLFEKVVAQESVKFTYKFDVKPHGRSVGLSVDVAGFMKTDESQASAKMSAVDQQRAEMNMLNSIIAQVDYNYRIVQHELRLARSNQKLVSIGVNQKGEASYIVELDLISLWSSLPNFFEDNGFKVTDLNEPKKLYYVDFEQPETSFWDSIWGDEVTLVEFADGKYQIKLFEQEDSQKTAVTVYDESGVALSSDQLEKSFPAMESGLYPRDTFLGEATERQMKKGRGKGNKKRRRL